MMRESMLLSQMIGVLIDIMGERGIFTEEEYRRLQASMTINSSPSFTYETLEHILYQIRSEKNDQRN